MTPLQQKIQNTAAAYIEEEAGWGPTVEELAEILNEDKKTIKGCIGSLVAAGLGYTEHDGRVSDCYYPLGE